MCEFLIIDCQYGDNIVGFNQKTAYEMRISDWSSDVCSSDLLLHYGGTGKPIVFIPSLINPHVILDLSERNSLLKFLSGRGLNVFLVDWGWPAPGDRELGLKGHIEHRLLPMLAALGETPVLAGYCLGGTIAAATCELMDVSEVGRAHV